MEMMYHPHRSKEVDIEHALNRLDVRVNGCHSVANATAIHNKSVCGLGRHLHFQRHKNLRIVNEEIQTPLGQLRNILLQLNNRLLVGNIQFEPSNPGFVKMLARLEGEKSGDGVDAAALVLEDEGLPDATGTAPCN